MGVVERSTDVIFERKRAEAIVPETAVVKHKRVSSNSCALCATGIEQQRCRAHCCIGTAVVEHQRSSAYSSIEAAVGIGKERKPTKGCVSSTVGEGVKRVASFRSREVGIAPIRRYIELALRSWQKRKTGQHRQDDHQYSIFHRFNFLSLSVVCFSCP